MTESLQKYQIEQLHTIQGEIKTILSTHVDDDHDVQLEINSSLQVLKVQVTAIQDELKKLSAKTSTTWDYVQKALGGGALIGFLLMAMKYIS
jgi:hypothetical protein